jgi:hypothetical protein
MRVSSNTLLGSSSTTMMRRSLSPGSCDVTGFLSPETADD